MEEEQYENISDNLLAGWTNFNLSIFFLNHFNESTLPEFSGVGVWEKVLVENKSFLKVFPKLYPFCRLDFVY